MVWEVGGDLCASKCVSLAKGKYIYSSPSSYVDMHNYVILKLLSWLLFVAPVLECLQMYLASQTQPDCGWLCGWKGQGLFQPEIQSEVGVVISWANQQQLVIYFITDAVEGQS